MPCFDLTTGLRTAYLKTHGKWKTAFFSNIGTMYEWEKKMNEWKVNE